MIPSMLDGMPVFSDEEFASIMNNRQHNSKASHAKHIGTWTVTLFNTWPEIWVEPHNFKQVPIVITIIYKHLANEPGIFINNRGITKEQLFDIIADSGDVDLQNFFLFNRLI